MLFSAVNHGAIPEQYCGGASFSASRMALLLQIKLLRGRREHVVRLLGPDATGRT